MPEQLVTVGSYSTLYEANLIKNELEAFDVDAVLADDSAINLNWLWSNLLGGVKVRMPQSKVSEARRVLALENLEEVEAAEYDVACPVCGSRQSHAFVDKRGSFLTWLVFGIPLIPAFSRRLCDRCGAKFRVS